MTAEEFRTRWTGHVPKVQDVTGEYAVLVPLVERPEGLCLLYEVRADTCLLYTSDAADEL